MDAPLNLMESEDLTPIDSSFGEEQDYSFSLNEKTQNSNSESFLESHNTYREQEEGDENDLPDGWIARRHRNSLYFYYHIHSGAVVWTKPYVRKFRVEDHTPPLSAFKVILQHHEREVQEADRHLQAARKRRIEREEVLKKTQSIVEKAFQEGSQVTINPVHLGKNIEQNKPKEEEEKENKQKEQQEREKRNERDKDAPRSGKEPKAPIDSKEGRDNYQKENGEKRKRNDDEDRHLKKTKSEITRVNKEVQVEDENEFSLKSNTTFVPTSEVTIPLDVQKVQAYLIMLVAAMVKLEKRRKRRSYEDFLAEDDDGSEFRVRRRRANPMDLDPTGKTPISFLQEYGLSVLKAQPEYRTSVQEDPSNPFITTVFIGGTEYGTAAATSKKISKQLAAEKTLDILCPGLYHSKQKSFTDQKPKQLELKDVLYLRLDDEAILLAEGLPKTPVQILAEYCTRHHRTTNYEYEDIQLEGETEKKFKATAKLDEMIGVAFGKNKRDAKQKAAQIILKQLHPKVKTFGDLLDLYSFKKEDDRDAPKGPNFALLEKLKEEMRKNFPTIDFDQTPVETAWQKRDWTRTDQHPEPMQEEPSKL